MTILLILLGILIFLILTAFLLLFSTFSVILSTEGKSINIKIKVLGIGFSVPLSKKEKKTKKKKEEKEKNVTETEESVMKKFFDLRNNFNRSKKAIELVLIYLRKRIEISDFGVMGEFGTGNAAATGMAYGAVNAFANTVLGFLGQYFSIKKPPVTAVKLNYEKAVFNMKFAFMVKTKLWYLLKAFFIYRNNTK